jgi:hypothetical protein
VADVDPGEAVRCDGEAGVAGADQPTPIEENDVPATYTFDLSSASS